VKQFYAIAKGCGQISTSILCKLACSSQKDRNKLIETSMMLVKG